MASLDSTFLVNINSKIQALQNFEIFEIFKKKFSAIISKTIFEWVSCQGLRGEHWKVCTNVNIQGVLKD